MAINELKDLQTFVNTYENFLLAIEQFNLAWAVLDKAINELQSHDKFAQFSSDEEKQLVQKTKAILGRED